MNSRFNNTLKNSFFALINQIVVLLLNIISRTIFIKILGIEYLGISGLFSDILIMLSLSDLGLGTAMVYSYYKPISEDDHIKITQLTNFYKKIYVGIAFFVLLVGLSLTPFLKYLVNLDHNVENLYLYYFLLLGNTVASYLFVYKTSILSAAQKNYIISKTQTIVSFIKLILQICILIITKSYALFLLIQIVTTILNNVILSQITNKIYPYINEEAPKLKNDDKHQIHENIRSMFLYKVAQVFFGGTDNTLISIIVGTVWVGYYSNYNMVISAINGFINVLYNSATASIGNVIATDKEGKKYEVFKFTQMFSCIITTITTVCLLSLLSNFIQVWVGQKFVLSNTILISIILNYYFNSVIHPVWSFREACGLYRRTKYIMLYAALINLILSIIMGYYFGMAGILLASLIARLSSYFWYEPKILFNEYFKQPKKNFYLPLLENFIFTSILCTIAFLASKNIVVHSWLALILKSIVIFVISSAITILFYSKNPDFKLIINRYIKSNVKINDKLR